MMTKLKHIRLRVLLNLAIGAVFVVVATGVVISVNHNARQQALNEAAAKARIILDRNLATHTYFTHNLKPSLFKWTEPFLPDDYFDPTWMSSTYAVREIDDYFQDLTDAGYYYKEAAISARSPENEADAYERDFIQQLNEDPDLVARTTVRNIDGQPYFVTLRRGEVMQESCLRCHSTPQAAPSGLIDVYGPDRSFGREVGNVVSAISIRVPLADAYASADGFTRRVSGLLLVLLLGLFASHFWLNRRLLLTPLDRIRAQALQISNQSEHVGEQIPMPFGRELRQLTQAFNTMSASLRSYMDELEARVRKRTDELYAANAQLEHELAERKRAEGELERTLEEVQANQARLEALSRRLVQVQEAERRQIAYELHEDIAQRLTAIQITLDAGTRLPPEEAHAELDEARTLIQDLVARIRTLSYDLRPAPLSDLGLLPALVGHFKRYTERTGIEVAFAHRGLEQRFPPEVETTAFRIVQEALTNAERHAGTPEVAVRAWTDETRLHLGIEDEGAGFHPETMLGDDNPRSLDGLRERASWLGGRLTVESKPDAGTRITAELPLR